MKTDPQIRKTISRQLILSAGIYMLPVLLMLLTFSLTGQKPWLSTAPAPAAAHLTGFRLILHDYWLAFFILGLGAVEFAFGLYEARWTKNEKFLDIVSFSVPYLVTGPAIAYFSVRFLPIFLPQLHNRFAWVPLLWGIFIVCVADDLTQYWYHRLHHQLPWLWRFHRAHHSAPYMGMAMASRQNLIYTVLFSQLYLTAALAYLGLGRAAAIVLVIKSVITTLAHSSIPWDKPFYKYKILHPAAWILERLISTPATHHAHHADTADDGIGYYKGNFGNMFFLWDVIFGTAHISRQYPRAYGISHYERDPWYAQFLWPVFKSNVAGSELASDGPMVRHDIQPQTAGTGDPYS
jgi:sterol desaturase/sphingolipid hydroxylase (fatty acid hydroxylase superfamily)